MAEVQAQQMLGEGVRKQPEEHSNNVQMGSNDCLLLNGTPDCLDLPTQDKALSQLLSSFPGTPQATHVELAKALNPSAHMRPSNNFSSNLDPASPSPAVLRVSPHKRSRLHLSSSDGWSGDFEEQVVAAGAKRHGSNNQHETEQDENMSTEDAAALLLHMKYFGKSAHKQLFVNPPQQPMQAQTFQAQHMATIQDLAQDMPAQMLEAAAAAAGTLAASNIPKADLALACQQWAQHYFGQQAALDAAVSAAAAASNANVCAPQMSPALSPLRTQTGGSQSGPVQTTPPASNSRRSSSIEKASPPFSWAAGNHSSNGRTSPFAALARIARQSTQAQEVEAHQPVQETGAKDQTAAFANMWTQQIMTKLPHIKTKADANMAAAAEAGVDPMCMPESSVPAGAAELSTDTPHSSALASTSPLRPGLLVQCLNAAAGGPETPSPLAYGTPSPVRAYTFLQDESVFSREIASKVSKETQAAIRTAWANTGRMAVSCGPAGRKGLSGIFTLSPSGRPVIWVPKNHSAATRLRALVLAGGGSAEVPAGFEEIEPKVFEDRAGKAKTHNWQLSIVLADYSTIATPKSKMPNVKLGHFVRIVGIPTAKV